MKYIIIILVIFSSYGCQHEKDSKAKLDHSRISIHDSIFAENSSYDVLTFPLKLVKNDSRDTSSIDSTSNSYLSYFLYGFGEDSLSTSTDTTIRFLWLRSFDKPVLVKIYKQGKNKIAEIKIGSGSGGYSLGKVEYKSKLILNDSIWRQLFNENFNQVLTQPSIIIERSLSDGAIWALEIAMKNKYYLRLRNSPRASLDRRPDTLDLKNFAGFCENLIKISKYPIDASLEDNY